MSKIPTNDFRHLWNDLPQEERSRLMPHMLEVQILHLWQSQQKAIASHQRLMREFDEHIKNCEDDLRKYREEMSDERRY